MRTPNLKLLPSTSFTDNLALVNRNFDEVVEYGNDFIFVSSDSTVLASDVPPGPLTVNPDVIAGDTYRTLLVFSGYQDTSPIDGTIVSFKNKVTIRVDTNDFDHQFPDGTALTAGQRTFVSGSIIDLTPAPVFKFTFNNRPAYLYQPVGSFFLRNLDASTHSYFITFDTQVLIKKPTTQFD